MKRLFLCLLIAAAPAAAGDQYPAFWEHVRGTIGQNLGRPYVWGTSGLKAFDCSGFVWRVYFDNGVLLKRTTARKYYLSLSPVPKGEPWRFGDVIVFDNLKHCGIVNSPSDFYHAQLHLGTNLSPLRPFWYPKLCGVRRLTLPARGGGR